MQHADFLSQGGIVTDPTGITFGNIQPGDVNTAQVTLTNTRESPMKLSGLLQQSGDLFEGETPLTVQFRIDGGAICPNEPNAVLPLGNVSISVTGEMPLTAGNEYQLATGQATYYFTANEITREACFGSETPKPTVPAPLPGGEGLPITGSPYAPFVSLGFTLLLSAAVLFFVRRLWRSRRCQKPN